VELAGSLIVSQQGQSSRPSHQTCTRSSQVTQAPQTPEGSTPAGAPPRVASLRFKPDSPLAAHLSHVARSRGGGYSSGRQSARPEHAAVGCGCR
jgi:hypothetical protein